MSVIEKVSIALKIVSRNIDVDDSVTEDLEGSQDHDRENVYHVREYLNRHEQTVGRNMMSKTLPLRDRWK